MNISRPFRTVGATSVILMAQAADNVSDNDAVGGDAVEQTEVLNNDPSNDAARVDEQAQVLDNDPDNDVVRADEKEPLWVPSGARDIMLPSGVPFGSINFNCDADIMYDFSILALGL